MKAKFTLFALLFIQVAVFAQDYPQKINVPPVSEDPNQQLTVLHYDNQEKGEFTVLYYQIVNATVCREGEFVADTGSWVYKDKKFSETVHGSSGVMLLKKQTFDASGKILLDQKWVVATRKFDGMGEYKLYFRPKYVHPLITNRMVVEFNIYNTDLLKGLNQGELKAVNNVAESFMPREPQVSQTYQTKPRTIADDLKQMKSSLSGLNQVAGGFKGDLPSGEKVLTRFPYAEDKVFAVTKTKGDNFLLKFYLTTDYKKFDFLDSVRVSGDVNLVSVATLYNTNSEPVGAFTNIHLKTKDEKGEDMLRQYSFAMDANFKVNGWIHSVGKNKMGSLMAEFGWYEGDKLWLISTNSERVFKTYQQLTLFVKGQAANTLFPASEEEKGTEKHINAKTFQPEKPFTSTGVTPSSNDYEIPQYITTVGETRYIITQNSYYNTTTNVREYSGNRVYRIDGKGKITNIDMMSEYVGQSMIPIRRIIKNSNSEYFLIPYPVILQEAFFEDKSELSPMTADNSVIMQRWDREMVTSTPNGSLILKRSAQGSKFTLLFYGKQ